MNKIFDQCLKNLKKYYLAFSFSFWRYFFCSYTERNSNHPDPPQHSQRHYIYLLFPPDLIAPCYFCFDVADKMKMSILPFSFFHIGHVVTWSLKMSYVTASDGWVWCSLSVGVWNSHMWTHLLPIERGAIWPLACGEFNEETVTGHLCDCLVVSHMQILKVDSSFSGWGPVYNFCHY